MATPRDNQDRFMKLMVRCPRMVRVLLALLPAHAGRRDIHGTSTVAPPG